MKLHPTILSMPRGPKLVRTASAKALAASMLDMRTSCFLALSLQSIHVVHVVPGLCRQSCGWSATSFSYHLKVSPFFGGAVSAAMAACDKTWRQVQPISAAGTRQ